jgi:hypothetical protein
MRDEELAARFWSTLSKAHSGLEQLAFLSSLRDPNTGLYEDADFRARFGPQGVDQALRIIHEQVFARWLDYRLEEKAADIELYLAELPADKATVVRVWRHLETYRNFIPELASLSDRQLFVCDVETVLALLDAKTLSKASGGPDGL